MFNRGIKNRGCGVLLVLFLGVFLPLSAQKNYNINKKYAPEALKQDTRILKEAMLQMHPAIGIYQPKSFYEKLFDDLIASLNDSLTEKAFRIKLKLLLYNFHCGHTEVLPSKAYARAIKPMSLNFLPYYIMAINDHLYSVIPVNTKKDSALRQGTEILKINGISADSILGFSRRMMFSDGFISSGRNYFLRTGINYYYPGYFGRPDSFLLEIKKEENVKSIWVKASNLKDLPSLPVGVKEDTLLTKHRRAYISEGYIENNDIYVLKVKAFKSSRYKRIYRRAFHKMKRNGTRNLVLDLRGNGGGSLGNSYRLLSYLMPEKETITLRTHVKKYPEKKYASGKITFRLTKLALRLTGTKRVSGDTIWYTQKLKPRKKDHFNGHVYILVNGGSFSASCVLAAYLKESKRAILIGTETGGTNEGCNAGITTYYTLPNSRMKVRVPAFRIIHDISPRFTGHGVLPDHVINYSFNDVLRRKDLEMAKVKELVKK